VARNVEFLTKACAAATGRKRGYAALAKKSVSEESGEEGVRKKGKGVSGGKGGKKFSLKTDGEARFPV